MKAVLIDIGDQLQLCAALMSDPGVLRLQPHIVASQFRVAASRIEQLKAFLEKPAKGVSADKPWFDKSVLDGICSMVDTTLRRHLLPLTREYKFPKIFEKELKVLDLAQKENMVTREIKETNCMGAMVVLYFLLYWHIALILLNRKHHPACYADVQMDEDDEGVIDFQKTLIDRLPKGTQMLEYRRFAKMIGALSSSGDKANYANATPLLSTNMVDDDNDVKDLNKRATPTVSVLRDVLNKGLYVSAYAELQEEIHALLALCITDKMDLFGGVTSTFDLQDDIEKWGDMYKPCKVQSTFPDANKRGFAQYSYRLAHVLKNKPYSNSEAEFILIARRAVVNDYGSVALMTDISKSFLVLSVLVKGLIDNADEEIIRTYTGRVIAQAYERYDKRVRDKLNGLETASKDTTEYHKTEFIQPTLSWRRSACDVKDQLSVDNLKPIGKMMIDDLAGYYWGARPCGLDQFNHQYLACPSLEIDPQTGSGMLNRLQTLCSEINNLPTKNRSRLALAVEFLVTLHRNSLFVLSMCKSLDKLADVFKPHALGMKFHIEAVQLFKPYPVKDANMIQTSFRKQSLPTDYKAPDDSVDKVVQDLSIIELKKRLQRELAALQGCINQVKSANFQKYPGISWPLSFSYKNDKSAARNNFEQFERVSIIPDVTPSVQESTDRLSKILMVMSRTGPYDAQFGTKIAASLAAPKAAAASATAET